MAATHAMIKATCFYGGLTFLAGFAFGVLRELFLVPMYGRRAGHLIEFPMILAATVTTAAYAVGTLKDTRRKHLLALGIAGTFILLAIESGFALYVMRVPLSQYLASFNVAKGELFPFGLVFMCLAPLAVHRFWNRKT